MCYSNPCLNGGVCTRREGGYTCICRENYTGECVYEDLCVGFRATSYSLVNIVRRSVALQSVRCSRAEAEIQDEERG